MLGQKSARGGGEGEIGAPGGIGDDAVTLHLQQVGQAQHVRRQGQRLAASQRLEQIVVGIAVPGIAQAGKGSEKTEGHHLGTATGIEVDRPAREFAAQRRRQFASVAADAPEVVVGRVANDTHCIFRPARFTQNATDLQRTLTCRLGIAGSDDHLSRPQAQRRQRVLHDLLGSQADKNAWLERHLVLPKTSEAVIVHFLPALASPTRALESKWRSCDDRRATRPGAGLRGVKGQRQRWRPARWPATSPIKYTENITCSGSSRVSSP
jgi:hypothetical protein